MAILESSNLTVSAKGTLPRVPFAAIKEKVLGKRYELSISFVDSATAKRINIERRNKDYTPNTLSFGLSKSSGEIIMCRSVIKEQHRSFAMSYETYLTYLCIHSMLHLKGYTHGGTMERKEKQLLSLFIPKIHEATNRRRH